MKRLIFESNTPATLAGVSNLRHSFTPVATYCVQSIENQIHILICLSEALTNLVQHNNASLITIRFSQDSHRWWLDILDDGDIWDPSSLDTTYHLDEMTTIESNRGVALLHTLSEQIRYTSDNESTNKLELSWQRPNKRTKEQVLVVEDDASLRRLYQSYLMEEFDVKMAENGLAALEIIQKYDIKLIISDIHMPLMDGLTFREKLAQEKEQNLIPFIFISSNDQLSMLQRSTRLGIDDYLVKPVHKAMLTQSITRVLQRSEQVFHQLTERIERQITSVLKPNLPVESHGWRLASDSRNTGFGGGDLLLHTSCDNNFSFIVADIMGHDDSAKFFSYAYAGYLHGLINSSNDSLVPSQFLHQLSNNALKDNLLSKVTFTSCVANMDEDGNVQLASAGHPQPILITKTGIEYLNVGGILPGLVDNARYQQLEFKLKQGERIAFYTDGLFESAVDEKSRNQLEQQILTVLLETITLDIDVALTTIMEQFDLLTSNYVRDDVTLLLIEKNELE